MPAIDQFSVIHHLFYEKWSGICHFHDIVCVYYGGSRIDQQFSQKLLRHSMNETNPKLACWLGDFQMAVTKPHYLLLNILYQHSNIGKVHVF